MNRMGPDATPLIDLVRNCLDSGRADAWEALLAHVQPLLARVVFRVATEWGHPKVNDMDDVIQEICLKLGANRGEFLHKLPVAGEASAIAYLKVAAANCARDHFRSIYAEKRSEGKTVESETADLNVFVDAEPGIERAVLLRQLDSNLEANDRERTIFWLYYRQGFSAREISQVPVFALTAKGVESVLHRLTGALRRKLGGKGDSACMPS
jgi:RNA polymerase sigma-70 factor (ECF subfamily)